MAYDPKTSKMKQKIIPVDYTGRNFDSIKKNLTEHAKRYYPDTFRDFNEASFGSMMLDTVAYVGDMLSFYLDYQANESFLDTSIEYSNIVRHAQRLGYDPWSREISTSGIISVYLTVPATTAGAGPDLSYAPTLRRGATFESNSGVQYTLAEDIDFALDINERAVAAVDEGGSPSSYAIKATGLIISGGTFETNISIGEYLPYRQVEIIEPNMIEILSVIDSSGNEYFEVDYLSQDTVYASILNPEYNSLQGGEVQELLKPFSVPYRFTTERQGGTTTVMQFGAGSESELRGDSIVDPSKVVLSQYGKNYVSDKSFDPTKLLQTEKLGIGPANTMLTIIYRANNTDGTANSQTDTVQRINDAAWSWKDQSSLVATTMQEIITSAECTNEFPIIGDIKLPTSQEIKHRAKGVYASQNRAVTRQDYVNQVYSLPSRYGAVKRCAVMKDHKSLKRNLNLYVISENTNNRLISTPISIKKNIKVWLAGRKMLNDTIDILNARRVSFDLTYSVLASTGTNKYEVLASCNYALESYFSNVIPDIGEPFSISNVTKLLNSISGVDDVIDIDVIQKDGSDYGDIKFDIFARTTPDRRMITVPLDTIWEVRHPESDIHGVIR